MHAHLFRKTFLNNEKTTRRRHKQKGGSHKNNLSWQPPPVRLRLQEGGYQSFLFPIYIHFNVKACMFQANIFPGQAPFNFLFITKRIPKTSFFDSYLHFLNKLYRPSMDDGRFYILWTTWYLRFYPP